MCEKPGSPFVLRTAEDHAFAEQILAQAERDLEDSRNRVEELEAEVASLREKSGIDEDKLIDLLDRRYAKKAGRKPAGTAA